MSEQQATFHDGKNEVVNGGAGHSTAIFNFDGKVKIIRRADNGMWGFPSAGWNYYGGDFKSFEDFVEKTIKERYGATVEGVEILDIICGGENNVTIRDGKPVYHFTAFTVACINADDHTFVKEGMVTEEEWADARRLQELLDENAVFPHNREMFSKIIEAAR